MKSVCFDSYTLQDTKLPMGALVSVCSLDGNQISQNCDDYEERDIGRDGRLRC